MEEGKAVKSPARRTANPWEWVCSRGTVWPHVYRFEKYQTRSKSSRNLDFVLTKSGIIHFASGLEKLYQDRSVL